MTSARGKAVNTHGGFGKWEWAVSRHPWDVVGLIKDVVSI